jgi:hypothetical protein
MRLQSDVPSGSRNAILLREVSVRFALGAQSAMAPFNVELAATDDFGNRDDFFRLGTAPVERRQRSHGS